MRGSVEVWTQTYKAKSIWLNGLANTCAHVYAVIMQMLGWRGRSCDDYGCIQHAFPLFLGCKGGAIPGCIRCKLWGVLAGHSALRYKPSCKVSGSPQAIAWHHRTWKLLEIPVWCSHQTYQRNVGRDQEYHWVQGATISLHFTRHASNVKYHGSYPHCCLLDHSRHCSLCIPDHKPYRHEQWVSHRWLHLVQPPVFQFFTGPGLIYNISVCHTDFRYTSWTTESWELSTLAHKVSSIHEHLIQQLIICHQHIGEALDKRQLTITRYINCVWS